MGRVRHKRTHHARRDVSRGARTRARKLDADQIQSTLSDAAKLRRLLHPAQLDVDAAGLGLFYCVECDRHFPSQRHREDHAASKRHKRVAKRLAESPAYTVEESLRAAGVGVDNVQRRPRETDQAMRTTGQVEAREGGAAGAGAQAPPRSPSAPAAPAAPAAGETAAAAATQPSK